MVARRQARRNEGTKRELGAHSTRMCAHVARGKGEKNAEREREKERERKRDGERKVPSSRAKTMPGFKKRRRYITAERAGRSPEPEDHEREHEQEQQQQPQFQRQQQQQPRTAVLLPVPCAAFCLHAPGASQAPKPR